MHHGKKILNFLLFEVFCITNLFCTRVKYWYDLHNILEWSFHHSQSRVLYILKGTKIICHYPFGQKNSFGFFYLLAYQKDSKLSKMYKLQQYFFCTHPKLYTTPFCKLSFPNTYLPFKSLIICSTKIAAGWYAKFNREQIWYQKLLFILCN